MKQSNVLYLGTIALGALVAFSLCPSRRDIDEPTEEGTTPDLYLGDPNGELLSDERNDSRIRVRELTPDSPLFIPTNSSRDLEELVQSLREQLKLGEDNEFYAWQVDLLNTKQYRCFLPNHKPLYLDNGEVMSFEFEEETLTIVGGENDDCEINRAKGMFTKPYLGNIFYYQREYDLMGALSSLLIEGGMSVNKDELSFALVHYYSNLISDELSQWERDNPTSNEWAVISYLRDRLEESSREGKDGCAQGIHLNLYYDAFDSVE